MPDPRDLSDMYNTPLKPAQEAEYLRWAEKAGRTQDSYDYDMRGAWRKGITANPNGHFPDTFKKPNHPTFSDQSIYHGQDGMVGGTWSQDPQGRDAFQPGPANMHWHGPERLQQYFQEREPDGVLLPYVPTR